jgi:hypothetical protein
MMKDIQCSEAESTANHPVFSAPGLTRHRAACCVSRYVSRYVCVLFLTETGTGALKMEHYVS